MEEDAFELAEWIWRSGKEESMNCANLPEVMVSMAQTRAVSDVLKAVVTGIAQCRNVVLTRIWLIRPGDRCGECRFRRECPDQSFCLHLVASAGNPADPRADYSRLDGQYSRFPLGVRKIGRIGKSGEPLFLGQVRGDEDWIAEPAWIQKEEVQTFAGQPLVFRGEVLGVLALFDCGAFGEPDFQWLRVFADHAAVSLANARAFEEIEYLKARLEEENDYLREEVISALGVGDLIGGSPGLTKVIHQIRLVAPTDASVLIMGESGTGKELVARAIHENSGRKGHALIKVNCGAVPDTLFESEFFGHAKGSFSGAVRDRPGRFELADGGTLFLDEIGEVPLALQAKLLRVLQEQEVERIGEVRTRKVSVRVIAATNRDLKKEVEAGRFREDLYFRLSVFPIEIPPLRQRREDIVPLAGYFIQEISKRMNRTVPRVTQGAMNRLMGYEWPGNVRELQNVVERALILSQGGPLQFELPSGEMRGVTSDRGSRKGNSGLLTREDLKERERDSIISALTEAKGKVFGVGGAAELLGMKPTTLASRIKALGIQKNGSRAE